MSVQSNTTKKCELRINFEKLQRKIWHAMSGCCTLTPSLIQAAMLQSGDLCILPEFPLDVVESFDLLSVFCEALQIAMHSKLPLTDNNGLVSLVCDFSFSLGAWHKTTVAGRDLQQVIVSVCLCCGAAEKHIKNIKNGKEHQFRKKTLE